MNRNPCADDPDLWFGYPDDNGTDGAAKARSYESAALEARALCLRRCPLALQRQCAQRAVEHGVEFGVWAGIKLPGNQYRKRGELERAHETLRRIAAGEINARELPENAALLERRQHHPIPAVATVFHLGRPVGTVSAA
ncbi:WhiB family transcriptional regulator [Mycolicibacterium sp.]|uniref:WhiB family transcriptional regulator n=1 Tax=Mycolicibacterium sp. TaxID=2320850 RepID=UPI00355EADA5